MNWKERIGLVIMGLGLLVVFATPIIDILLAVNGIIIPSALTWCLCMIGVACLGLGVVFTIDSVGRSTQH